MKRFKRSNGLDTALCKNYLYLLLSDQVCCAVDVNCLPPPPQVKLACVYLRDSTLISPFPILLFGGTIEVQHKQMVVTVDEVAKFKVSLNRFPHTL